MTETLLILGEEIYYEIKRMDIYELRFFVDNPRIYSKLQGNKTFNNLDEDTGKQKYIQDQMWKEPSVMKLIPEIEHNKGLRIPILVTYRTLEVIEGNSRLAAYRKLHEDHPNDERWHTIRCHVVADLTPTQQDSYLHGEHVKGKTEWRPYEKAYRAYKRVIEDKKPLADYADIVGETVRSIRTQVEIIQLMHDNDDTKIENWSYYEILVKNRKINESIMTNPRIKTFLVEKIKEQKVGQEFFTAQELRDAFPAISSKPKILKKLMNGDMNFQDAYYHAKPSEPLKNIKAAKVSIENIENSTVKNLNKSDLNALKLEIKNCRKKIVRLEGMIKTAEEGNSNE